MHTHTHTHTHTDTHTHTHKHTQTCRENCADLPLGSGSKRPTPDRFPMENFGIPNSYYRETSDSQPNTPVILRHEEELKKEDLGTAAATVAIGNSNSNGNVGATRDNKGDRRDSLEEVVLTEL